MAAIGAFRHRALLEAPGDVQPDPDGGWTDTYAPLEPAEWFCSIRPASAKDLETIGAGTVLGQQTHVCRGRFHGGISLKTRLTVRDAAGILHTLSIVGVTNPDLRCVETEIVGTEVVE